MIAVFGSDTCDFEKLLECAKVVKKTCYGEAKILEVLLDCKKVLFVITGYNKVNIGLAAAFAIEHYEIDAIIGIGNCGSLIDCPIKLGDIAIANETVQYSVDSTALGYPDTVIPRVGLGIFKCSTKFVRLAQDACNKLNYDYKTNRIATAEQFVANEEERCALHKTFHSEFLDMESGNLAQVAYLFNLPCVFVKGVSNYANDCAVTDYEKCHCFANKRSNEVVACILKMLGCCC